MKTQFSLKNFRVFDHKQGATFNLAPLTVLTGCNSSGKSSVVKAILLLRDFFEQLRTQNIANCKLDFGNKLAKLGKFDTARNNNSRKGSKMTFAYTVRTNDIDQDLWVQLSFEANKDDALNNGYLKNITLSNSLGNILLDAEIRINGPRYHSDEEMEGYIPFDRLDGEATIHKLDLTYFKSCFLKKYIKQYLYDIAWNSTISKPSKILDNLLEIARSHFSDKEYNEISENVKKYRGGFENTYQDRCGDALGQRFKFSYDTILKFAKSNLVHYMPLVGWTYGISKSDTRKVILKKINEMTGDTSMTEIIIDVILSDFEKSEYPSFVEYLREKENRCLVFDKAIAKEDITLNSIDTINALANCYYESNSDNLTLHEIYNNLIIYQNVIDPTWITRDSCGERITTLLDEFMQFCNVTISDALTPSLFRDFEYLGDATINILRLYTTERNDEFGQLLFKYLNARKKNRWRDINAGDFINKWVKKFGLGNHLSISQTDEGLGVIVKLHKSANDKQGRLLADEGFGITKLIGIMLNIETAILSAKVGRGTSIQTFAKTICTLAIEEPENHLHPRYQALLAEMFTDAYKNYNIHFIVETHSEYMVRKLQTLVAKKELTPEEVSLQYVYNADAEKRPKGEPHVKNIEIREDGILRDSFGPGFFDEADNLAMDLLTIKAMG